MYSILVDSFGVELDTVASTDTYLVQPGYTWVSTTLPNTSNYNITTSIWNRIQEVRDVRQNQGITLNISGVDYWFHSDISSRIKYLGLVMMGASMPANISWKTMSGVFITMTPAIASSIFSLIATLDVTLFAIAENHKNTMLSSISPSTYNYIIGWSKGFGEL